MPKPEMTGRPSLQAFRCCNAKACGHSFQSPEGGGEMDHRGETLIGLVVAGRDAAKLLQVAEEILDKVAPAIHVEVTGYGLCPIGLGRDDGGRAARVQFGAEPIDVEGF